MTGDASLICHAAQPILDTWVPRGTKLGRFVPRSQPAIPYGGIWFPTSCPRKTLTSHASPVSSPAEQPSAWSPALCLGLILPKTNKSERGEKELGGFFIFLELGNSWGTGSCRTKKATEVAFAIYVVAR